MIEGTREPRANSNEEELERFRDQWRFELETREDADETFDAELRAQARINREAVEFFIEACRLEKSLKPSDILRSLHMFSKALERKEDVACEVDPKLLRIPKDDENGNSFEQEETFSDKLSVRLRSRKLRFEPFVASQPCHWNGLPDELIAYIARFVVSDQISLGHLHAFSQVCIPFFLISRSNDIWRRIFLRSTCPLTGKAALTLGHPSWYTLCVSTPRPLYNGVYVSRTSYIRFGETGFQDSSYRPYHTVSYYRYFRFFADGTVLMRSGSDLPENIIPLVTKSAPRNECLHGRFELEGKFIRIKVARVHDLKPEEKPAPRRKGRINVPRTQYGVQKQENHITFRLFGAPKARLLWVRYQVHVTLLDGTKNVSDMEINKYETSNKQKDYPPLVFQPVRAFAQEEFSENILE